MQDGRRTADTETARTSYRPEDAALEVGLLAGEGALTFWGLCSAASTVWGRPQRLYWLHFASTAASTLLTGGRCRWYLVAFWNTMASASTCAPPPSSW